MSSVHEEMERLPFLWIKDKKTDGNVVTKSIIGDEVVAILYNLMTKKADEGSANQEPCPESESGEKIWWYV